MIFPVEFTFRLKARLRIDGVLVLNMPLRI
jgi:hypothetical protein